MINENDRLQYLGDGRGNSRHSSQPGSLSLRPASGDAQTYYIMVPWWLPCKWPLYHFTHQLFTHIDTRQITGDRTAIPTWLLNATLRRNWLLVSADYRVLPESTAFSTVEDIKSAYNWATNSLNALFPAAEADLVRVIVAGSSAGGWCSLVCAAQFSVPGSACPSPRALLLICPMTDPGGHRCIIKGTPLANTTLDSDTAEKTLAEIQRRVENREVSFGEAFPKDEKEFATKKRLPFLNAIIHEGLYADYTTGIARFGERIRSMGKMNAIGGELETLFPLDFGITERGRFPRCVLVHGTADREVDVGESDILVERLRSVGSEVEFFPVKGKGHMFDHDITDCEDGDTENHTIQALQACLRALDCFLK